MATSKKSASCVTDVPDHLLVEIFLRLPAPDDLARASAACVSIRRLVTDGSFLRRFRRRHAPPLLGFLDSDGFNPALPPHPSASSARALARAADFSFTFLPSHCRWTVQDTRDGLVLLGRDPDEHEWPHVFTEFAVCDPLHRRHVLLPALPEDLAASVDHPVPRERWPWCEHFLFPLDEESQSPATAFRVICVALCEARFAAFVFSSCTRQWRATASSKGWSDLFHGSADSDRMTPMSLKFQRHHYANGCFYWDSTMISRKRLLVLDTRRMEFSIVDLPPGVWSTQGIGVVEAGEGRLGMFVFGAKIGPGLRYFIARNEGESPSEWHMQKTISLDSGYRYAILDATGSYLLLQRIKSSSQDMPLFEYFSIDTKTLQLQRVCAKQRMPTMFGTHTYTNFPPSLLLSPRAMLSGSMES